MQCTQVRHYTQETSGTSMCGMSVTLEMLRAFRLLLEQCGQRRIVEGRIWEEKLRCGERAEQRVRCFEAPVSTVLLLGTVSKQRVTDSKNGV